MTHSQFFFFKNKNFNIKDFSNLPDKNWIIKKNYKKNIIPK